MTNRHRLSGIAGLALAGMLALSACTATQPTKTETEHKGSDPASLFLACLTSKGVEAKINKSGQVLVRDTAQQQPGKAMEMSSGSGSGEALMMEGDETGASWVGAANSDYFANDPETQEAYAACEKEHPTFEQPAYEPENDPEMQKMQAEQGKAAPAFAQCARENGAPEFPDPEEMGALMIPDDMTEDEFRALAEACYDGQTPLALMHAVDSAFDPWDVLEEFMKAPVQ